MSGLLSREIVTDPRHYRLEVWTLCYNFFLGIELRLSMILILLVGPDLISQDLRFNALPLYLSRPLRRIDYLLGKLGVIGAFLAMVIIVPCLLAYVLGLLFSLDISIVRDTFGLLLATLGYALVIILSAGMLILALSSLSRNSRYVALFWLGIWIVSGIAATVLGTIDQAQRQHEFVARVQANQANPQRPARIRRDQLNFNNYAEEEMRSSETNWRPLVSYTANLTRVGRKLLGSDASWKKLSEFQPEERRAMFLLTMMGPQYPWYWSAGVLAALLGISAWILNFPLRSLDRQR
jgi:ABC-2 type transport system permease protein